MLEKIKEKIKQSVEAKPLIHPDFRIMFRVKDDSGRQFIWFQNRYQNFGEQLTIKIAFPVDDPSILDGCPFVAKIGDNINQEDHKYFALIYGDKNNWQAMKEWVWSKDIKNSKLLTYTGEFIQKVPVKP